MRLFGLAQFWNPAPQKFTPALLIEVLEVYNVSSCAV